MLKGKKTYLTGIGTILIAVGLWLGGVLDTAQEFQTVSTALLAIFLRKGIKSGAGK